jgi:hypothetical protein
MRAVGHRYFIRRRSGPYDAEALREMIRGGLIEEDDELSADGDDWVPMHAAMAIGPVAAEPPKALGSAPAAGAAAPAAAKAKRAEAPGEPKEEEEEDDDDDEEEDDGDGDDDEEDEDDDDDDDDEEEDEDEDDDEREVTRRTARAAVFGARPAAGREDTLRGGVSAPPIAPPPPPPPAPPPLPLAAPPPPPPAASAAEYTPLGPLAGRTPVSTLPGFGILPPATPVAPNEPARTPSVIVEAGAPGAAGAAATPPPAARLGSDSSEWSQTDMRKFFAGGEPAPAVKSEEDSLGDFESGRARAGRGRFGVVGALLALVAVAGLGVGGWYMWRQTRTPPRATEKLAARKGGGAATSAGPASAPAGSAEAEAAAGPGAATASAGPASAPASAGPASAPAKSATGTASAAAGGHPESAPASAAAAAGGTAAASALPPDARAAYDGFVAKGDKQLKAGAFGAAAKSFKSALEVDPAGAAAHAGLAAASIENGATGTAETEAQKAIALDASIASAYRTLALVYHERGKRPDACTNYKLFLAKGGSGEAAAEAKESMRDLGCK